MIARLRPGATVAEAQAQIDAHNAAMEAANPEAKMMADAGFRSLVVPLHDDHVAAIRPTLLLLQAGAFFLLLIGAVNLVNLLLIRASGRVKELAVRQAMGAGRGHIVSEVMVETTLLTVGGRAARARGRGGGHPPPAVLGADHLPLGRAHRLRCATGPRRARRSDRPGHRASALPIAWYNLRGHAAHALQSESRGARPAARPSACATASSSPRSRWPSCCSRERACSGRASTRSWRSLPASVPSTS